MADSLRLRVYTPERELFDGEVREVTAPGAYGEIGILPDHAALVTTLEPGVLSYKQDGRVGRYQIARRLRRGARQRRDRARRLGRAGRGLILVDGRRRGSTRRTRPRS